MAGGMKEILVSTLDIARRAEMIDTEHERKLQQLVDKIAEIASESEDHGFASAESALVACVAQTIMEATQVRRTVLLLARIEKSGMAPDVCALATEMKKMMVDYTSGR